MFKQSLVETYKTCFSIKTILCWLAGSILTGFAGPFGMYDVYNLWIRLSYWGAVLAVATFLALFIFGYTRNLRPQRSFWSSAFIALPIFTTIYGSFVLFVNDYLFVGQVLPPDIFVIIAIVVASLAILVVMYWLETDKTQKLSLSKSRLGDLKNTNPLLSKLDIELDTKLIRLHMRDHYVEVYLDTGMQLVHMRFKDAIEALSEFNGMQVHKSHWVNFDEVVDIFRKNGKGCIITSDGEEVPISRTRMADLKEMGFL